MYMIDLHQLVDALKVIYRIWCTFKAVLAQPILEQPKNKIG